MIARAAAAAAPSGRADREAARAKIKDDVRSETEVLIVEVMPYLANLDDEDSGHDNAIAHLIRKIGKAFKVTRDHQIAREYLEKRIERFNTEHDRDLAIPIAPVRFRIPRLRRTLSWCQRRRLLNEAHEELLVALDRNRSPVLSHDERLGLVLYFAVTYGGLCQPKAITALHTALRNNAPICAHSATRLVWLDLYWANKGACNEIVDGKLRVCRRWFIPPACRLPLLGYLRRQSVDEFEDSNASDFALINRAFKAISGQTFPPKSLKQFCSVGIAIAERQQGADLAELMVSYSTGAIESMSLRPTNWELVLANAGYDEVTNG